MDYDAAAREVRRFKIERSVIECIRLVQIREHLRIHPEATTRTLADICRVAAGREFMRFASMLRRLPSIETIGKRQETTGHINKVWRLAA